MPEGEIELHSRLQAFDSENPQVSFQGVIPSKGRDFEVTTVRFLILSGEHLSHRVLQIAKGGQLPDGRHLIQSVPIQETYPCAVFQMRPESTSSYVVAPFCVQPIDAYLVFIFPWINE